MSRITGPKCRYCRREQTKLYLKGEKCYGDSCILTKKQNYPGKAAYFSTRLSTYGYQLREKQKVKRIYGLNETHMKNLFNDAASSGGDKGLKLLQLLEMRLDNVTFLLGLAPSRAMARQLVSHGKIAVNGKKLDIPSHLLSVGDTIQLSDDSIKTEAVSALKEKAWLKRSKKGGSVQSEPTREMIDEGIRESLIIEFYSR